MAALGAFSFLVLRIGDGSTSGLAGLLTGVSAAPGLLVAGAPFANDSHYPLAVLGSIPLWLLLGWVASRRSTRSPVAGWSSYCRELFWLTIAVILGASTALIAASMALGESLVV